MGNYSIDTIPDGIEPGYCWCGCGGKTKKIRQNDPSKGYVKGEYHRYIRDHGRRHWLTPEQYFWSYTDKRGPDECWEWQGTRRNNYGILDTTFPRVRMGAHVFNYILHNGPVPDGMIVMHVACDNPPCVNPAHLKAGTQADNVHDMMEKGRMNITPPKKGSAHANSRLTDEQVSKIREMHATGDWTYAGLAEEFSISSTAVGNIITHKTYK